MINETIEDKEKKLINIISLIKEKEKSLMKHLIKIEKLKKGNNELNDVYNNHIEYKNKIILEKQKELHAMSILLEYLNQNTLDSDLNDTKEIQIKIINELKIIKENIKNLHLLHHNPDFLEQNNEDSH